MLLNAVELAKEPQSIVVLFHDYNMAEMEFHRAVAILDHNELGHNSYVPRMERRGGLTPTDRTRPIMRIEFPTVGSEVHFQSMYSRMPTHLLGSLGSVSILIDHYADELNTGTGGYASACRYWKEIIRVIQEKKETA